MSTTQDNKEPVWITKPEDVKTAAVPSLVRALLTSDGAGREVKKEALIEILARCLSARLCGKKFGPFFMDEDRGLARQQLGLDGDSKDESGGKET